MSAFALPVVDVFRTVRKLKSLRVVCRYRVGTTPHVHVVNSYRVWENMIFFLSLSKPLYSFSISVDFLSLSLFFFISNRWYHSTTNFVPSHSLICFLAHLARYRRHSRLFYLFIRARRMVSMYNRQLHRRKLCAIVLRINYGKYRVENYRESTRLDQADLIVRTQHAWTSFGSSEYWPHRRRYRFVEFNLKLTDGLTLFVWTQTCSISVKRTCNKTFRWFRYTLYTRTYIFYCSENIRTFKNFRVNIKHQRRARKHWKINTSPSSLRI